MFQYVCSLLSLTWQTHVKAEICPLCSNVDGDLKLEMNLQIFYINYV